MRSKLNYLIGVSLKRKIKTKWFLLANALLAVAIIGVFNIDHVINFFGGEFNQKQEIYILDRTSEADALFEQQFKTIDQNLNGDESHYELKKYEGDPGKVKEFLEENKKVYVLEFTGNPETILNAKIYSEGYIDTIETQMLTTAINNTKVALALEKSDIAIEDINKIYAPVAIEREYLNESNKSEDENMQMIMSMVFPAFILPFFMLSLFLVQMIGAEVNDEKTTRGMEIIISNVSPRTHFFSKMISGNLFVLIQGGLLLLFAGIGAGLRYLLGGGSLIGGAAGDQVGNMIDQVMSSGIGNILIYVVPLALILMVLTFVTYSLLAGILASMTTNTEDFQQLQTPIIIISLVGYFLAMMAGVFKGALFIRILSYIPLFSAILSPSLLVLGQIGVIDIIVSIALSILFNWVLIKYGLKIYKVGILNYSSTGLWKKMWKALKN